MEHFIRKFCIVGNYSEKNCRKFYRGKILRKIFRQNLKKNYFEKNFSSFLNENSFREKICAKVFA
jgi:hypothetical protein